MGMKDYEGSFLTFIQKANSHSTSAVDLVLEITKVFPTFRDQISYQGHEGTSAYKLASPLSSHTDAPAVILWKRAQILVADTWAAFYPKIPTDCHPIFPKGGIDKLTMFADYRVPQVLHHLQILHYPQSLIDMLESKRMLMYGSPEELSIRVASILAVERIRDEILDIQKKRCNTSQNCGHQVNSVLIDFYLWDLAKRLERGEEVIEGIQVNKIVPPHRTRSIWY
jgi:Potential Queuosine, Q, salvage protein family